MQKVFSFRTVSKKFGENCAKTTPFRIENSAEIRSFKAQVIKISFLSSKVILSKIFFTQHYFVVLKQQLHWCMIGKSMYLAHLHARFASLQTLQTKCNLMNRGLWCLVVGKFRNVRKMFENPMVIAGKSFKYSLLACV